MHKFCWSNFRYAW